MVGTATQDDAPAPASDEPGAPAAGAGSNGRAAAWAFGLVEIIAFPLLMFWGRGIWFNVDDWDFVAARQAGNIGDWFRPHFSHLTTLPILIYRFLFWLVGIRSYLPYQLTIIAFHLVAALLLREVMRRAGVRPWLATSAATLFVFFGSGAENILVAFQITFVGALVFGLAQLMLADHDGPFDRRDAWGLLAGFTALLFSGVAVAMVFVVGLATLMRRGWRIASLHTAPLAIAYAVWAKTAPPTETHFSTTTNLGRGIEFVWIGFRSTFGQLGAFWGAGILVLGVLLAGLAVIVPRQRKASWDKRLVVPVALLAGAPVFLVLTAFGRSGELDPPKGKLAASLFGGVKLAGAPGPEHAQQSRYLYIVAAFLLPAIVVGAQALGQRWRALAVMIPALLIAAVPINIVRFVDFRSPGGTSPQIQQVLLRVPRLPNARQLPRSLAPEPFFAKWVTVGWLLDNVANGRVPAPAPTSPVVLANLALALGLRTQLAFPNPHCHALTQTTDHELPGGDVFTVKVGAVGVQYAPPGGVASLVKKLAQGTTLVVSGALPLRMTPIADASGETTVVCY